MAWLRIIRGREGMRKGEVGRTVRMTPGRVPELN